MSFRDQSIRGRRRQATAEKICREAMDDQGVALEATRVARSADGLTHRQIVANALTRPNVPASDREVLHALAAHLLEPGRSLSPRQVRAVVGVLRASHAAEAQGRTMTQVFGRERRDLPPFLRGDTSSLPKAPPGRRAGER